jgi:hypothetical protein
MSDIVYKLGDGPINYDWNLRYVTFEGSDLSYGATISLEDKKTINILGAAVTNICPIKNKEFAFGIILNPPTNKIIYFACDGMNSTKLFREKLIKCTQNIFIDDSIMMNEFNDLRENDINKFNLTNINKLKCNNDKLFNIGVNIKRRNNPDTFYLNLEKLRKEYIVDDNRQIKKFERGLRITVSEQINYKQFFRNFLCNFFFFKFFLI